MLGGAKLGKKIADRLDEVAKEFLVLTSDDAMVLLKYEAIASTLKVMATVIREETQ